MKCCGIGYRFYYLCQTNPVCRLLDYSDLPRVDNASGRMPDNAPVMAIDDVLPEKKLNCKGIDGSSVVDGGGWGGRGFRCILSYAGTLLFYAIGIIPARF